MNGYNIKLIIPSMIKGFDFDFSAHRTDETINAEVTVSAIEEFSEETLFNTLRKKRKQLPNTAPAVIFFVVPNRWVAWENVVPDRFERVGKEFLRSTGRINALTFMFEIPRKFPNVAIGGMVAVGTHSYFNQNPRIPWAHGDILGGNKLNAELRNLVFETAEKNKLKKLRDNEFYKWVDSLTSE